MEKDYDDRAVWRAMARGIEGVFGREAFITYHPAGGPNSSSQYVHEEPWLDLNSFQSSHGSREVEVWKWVERDLALTPAKPTLDMEPCYEDHPVNPWDGKWTRQRGYFSSYDVRSRIYRGVFSGGCGVTYGHHHIWQFMNESLNKPVNVGDTIIPWQKAAKAQTAGEMKHLRNLMLCRPYFSRIPDQTMIKSGTGAAYNDLVTATRDRSGSYAMIYLPQNRAVSIDVGVVTGAAKTAWWFNPRTGEAKTDRRLKGKGTRSFTPPKDGQDWVLVIDDASKTFGIPGGK